MNKPVVSVIIPVYNRPAKAVRAIRSVLGQSYDDFEVIIVDDGSGPAFELPEKIREKSRVSIVRLEHNQGPSAARNAGAGAARGKWLAWLDSDDVWHSDKLARQMAWLNGAGGRGKDVALATGFEYVDKAGHRDRRTPVASSDPLMFFSGCWFCPGSTVILSRSLFERIGPYDESLRRLEDLDWFARMSLAGGRLEVVADNLATIRTGQKAPYKKVRKAGERLLAKYSGDAIELPSKALSNLRAYLHLEYGASALKREHKHLLGLGHLAASWALRPRTSLHLHDFWKGP